MSNKKIEPFLTVDQQIELLKERGLNFSDENLSKVFLDLYGYYEIINGYREPFLIDPNDKEKFQNDVDFSHIFSLFVFDNEFREILFNALVMFEIYFRRIVSKAFITTYSVRQSDYLNYKKFRTANNVNEWVYLHNKMNKIVFTESKLIAYHRKNHNNIPLYVLFKSKDMSFNDLVLFYNFQKKK